MGRHGAGEMVRHPGRRDEHFHASSGRAVHNLAHAVGATVGRGLLHFVRHTERVENAGGLFHGGTVGLTAKQNRNSWS